MKIILSITMIMILLSYTAATKLKSDDDERCGTQGGGRTCYDHRCCSQHGYCGTDEKYCLPKNDCQSNCWTGPGASNVIAYWTNYNANQHKYDLNVVKTKCSSKDADKPYAWRSKYGWTALCGPAGPQGVEACGKCLRVKNRETDAVVLKLRIVDVCGDGGLNLDKEMFDFVDSDGHGNAIGHLNVDYQFIDCDDEVNEKHDYKTILGSVIDSV